MTDIKFTKYQERGAYHWNWYEDNTYGYRDDAIKIMSYYPEVGTLLDIGCGDGLMCYLFYQKGFKVVGIDLDETGILMGKKKIQLEFMKQYPLPFLKSLFKQGGNLEFLKKGGIFLKQTSIYDFNTETKFDYSLCQEVLEHLPDPELLIEKIVNSTSKFCILSTPNGSVQKAGKFDFRLWDKDSLLDLMGKDRTEIIEMNEQKIFVRMHCS